jgi:hypothetical protein
LPIATTGSPTFRLAEQAHGPVEVIIRPEAVRLVGDEHGLARVVDREFCGHDRLITLELANSCRLLSRTKPSPVFDVGDRVNVGVDEVMAFPGHEHTQSVSGFRFPVSSFQWT